MHEMQRMFNGAVTPAQRRAANAQFLVQAYDPGDEPKVTVAKAVLMMPATAALARNLVDQEDENDVRQYLFDYFAQHHTCESLARMNREVRNGTIKPQHKPSAQMLKNIEQPEWYDAYLETRHWQHVRAEARHYYFDVCYCNDPCDEVHHRNYDCLGNETMADLTLLCRRHHDCLHAEKSFLLPRTPSSVVCLVFQNEGIPFQHWL